MFLNVVIRKHIQVYPQQWEDLSYCLLKHFRKKCGLGSQGGRTIFYCKKRSFIEIRNPSHSYLFHGIFLQRQKICKGIVSIMGRFWWVNQDNDRRIHWQNWSKLGEAKSISGLGFKDIEAFNKTLLAKPIWILIEDLGALASQILNSKYFKDGDVLIAKLGHQPSYPWRSVFSSIELIRDSMMWGLGTGQNISLWRDKWTSHPMFYSKKISTQIIY